MEAHEGPLTVAGSPRLMIFDSAWCTDMCKCQELRKPCCAMYRSMLEFATLTMQRRTFLLYCSSQNQTRIFSSSKSSTIAAKLHPKTLPGHDMPVRPRRRSRPLEPAQSFQNEEICSMNFNDSPNLWLTTNWLWEEGFNRSISKSSRWSNSTNITNWFS